MPDSLGAKASRALDDIRATIDRPIGKEAEMSYDITMQEVGATHAVAASVHANKQAIGEAVGRGFAIATGFLTTAHVEPVGPPFVMYDERVLSAEGGTVRVCFPTAGPLVLAGGVEEVDLPAGIVVVTTHRGPYDEISSAYRAVMDWIDENGYEVAGPAREIYLNEPSVVPPDELLTRVVVPIAGSGTRPQAG